MNTLREELLRFLVGLGLIGFICLVCYLFTNPMTEQHMLGAVCIFIVWLLGRLLVWVYLLNRDGGYDDDW